MKIVAPSLLAADFLNLDAAIEMINTSHADWLHLDVMDGVFVPNLSFGFSVVEALAPVCRKPLDIHLMITNPERYAERFCRTGAEYVSFHLNATSDAHNVIDIIRSNGVKPALAINPDIDVNLLRPYLKKVDMVLLMSVFAGYGGQKFIEATYERIALLKHIMHQEGAHPLIEIDGGVGLDNAVKLYAAGADALVAGTAVFRSQNPDETIKIMKQ